MSLTEAQGHIHANPVHRTSFFDGLWSSADLCQDLGKLRVITDVGQHGHIVKYL